jgi:hypothetical protein
MNQARSKQFLWILLLAVLVLTAIVASATTLEPMSFARLTRQATAIVRVRCVSVQSVWTSGEIWTDSRFEVLQQDKADVYGADQMEIAPRALGQKGSAQQDGLATQRVTPPMASAATITVRQLGGSLAGLHAQVDDVPQFSPGEEVYLFLWRRAGEPYRVLGWTQGTFRVLRDTRTGAARVTQDSAIEVFHGDVREYHANGLRNVPLAAFQEKLHAAIRGSATSDDRFQGTSTGK